MTVADRTIPEDVQDDDAGAEALLKRFGSEEPEGTEQESQETEEAPEETEEAEETQEGPEETTEAEETEASDDAVVKVKVDDKELKLKVADLKRLAGQEASLTRKSQELADASKRATDEGEKALALVSTMIQRADKAWVDNGYDKVDLSLAATRLSEAAYRQLKADVEAAHAQRVFLRQDGEALVAQVRANRQAALTAALATVDEKMAVEVPGWTKDNRKEVTEYAKTQGLPAEIADNLSDPAAIKVIRKAMLYDKGSKVAAKVKTTAVSTPTRTIKSGAQNAAQTDKRTEAMGRLRKSGSTEDAAAAFRARFG